MRSRLLAVAPLAFVWACSDSDVMSLGGADSGVHPDSSTITDTGTSSTTPDAGPMPTDAGVSNDGSVSAGMVELNTDTIDFGPVIVNTTDTRTLSVTNPSNDTVRVTIGAPSGRDGDKFTRAVAGSAGVDAFDIPPGGTVNVDVSVTPTDFSDLIATMALDSCFGSCPVAITLLATGADTGIACPAMYDVGFANPGGCVTTSVPCENRGNISESVTFVGLDPGSDPSFTLVEPALPFDFVPGTTAEFEVTFCPSDLRPYDAELIVATFMPVDREHTIQLRGVGGGPNVVCTPSRLDFGAVGVGAPVRRDVQCMNDGSDVGTVAAAFRNGAGLSLPPMIADIPPGDTVSFAVQVDATAAAVIMDDLILTTNDPDSPTIELPITAEVIDVAPCTAELAPTSRDFGLVSVGDTASETFTISNTGMETCLIADARLAMGSDAAFAIATPIAGSSIAGGAVLTFDVTFGPTRQSAALGTVAVSFSNPGTAELLADVSGAGGTSDLRFDPASIDFGAVRVGCAEPAVREVRVTNLSPDDVTVTGIQLVSAAGNVFGLRGLPSLPATIDGFGSGTFELTFEPTTAGAFTAEVRIAVDGQPVLSVLSVSGSGANSAERTDTFDFSTRETDLLFVVDDSCSMGPAQEALSSSIVALAQTLDGRGVDFHFGVVTTDMNNPARSGRLIGMPTVLDATTQDLADELRERVAPGIMGNGNEQGSLAARRAVTSPLATGQNAGFLRDTADLAVVFISDEADGSPSNPSVTGILSQLRDAAGQGALSVSAITGEPNDSCEGPYGDADAGPRYYELVQRGGGVWRSFCEDMGIGLRAIVDGLFGAPRFGLSSEPIGGSIVVTVNGAAVSAIDANGAVVWRYDPSRQSVSFTDGNAPANGANIEITYDMYCASASCGDGTPDPGEACDDGNMDNTDACVDGCRNAACGDGFEHVGMEACDDGNSDNGDECLNSCEEASCGDGFIERGEEDCDDGNTMDGDTCPANCIIPEPPGYDVSGIQMHNYEELANPTMLTPSTGGMPNIDDGIAAVSVPFAFDFWGVRTSTIWVSVNGVISTVGFGMSQTAQNRTFPDQRNPDGLMAPWWDDLIIIEGGQQCQNAMSCGPDATCDNGTCNIDSSLSYKVVGNTPDRKLIVLWKNVRHFRHTDEAHRRWSMQVVLEEGSSNIHFAYGSSYRDGGGAVYGASAGIENQDGSEGEEALSCTPGCDARPRPFPNGFPTQSLISITPTN